ncbi:hypothetical protein H257_06357 [Aphanomyces astaci]|uniref:Uncharacterized protein n=1 Tax=Aphanomyces astaci TaxID=112090 RepID=W4GNH0_APHAT|nr:hypothetical protein H257_06357 [Aphanomyces astaci]ETV80906.1 hypothetical protein H257_06357 [Aphanomyces astaci]|eukprot:XP_009829853.1 hypothetical protein H257_06357 [Aphanomyces astaci]
MNYQPSLVQQQLPLLRLAKICDWGGLRKAVDKASQDQIEATDDYGMHVLHWAVTEANIPLGLLEYLIRAFPHGVRTFSNGGFLPLHLALMAGASVIRVQRLVESFPQSTILPIPSGHTPIMIFDEHLPMDTQALKRADGQQGLAAAKIHVWGNILVGHVLRSSSYRPDSNRPIKPRRHSTSMSGLSTTSSSAATSSSSSTASSLRQSSEECPSFDWRELSRRMSANDPTLDDIVDDRAKLLLMAVMKAPFDLFQWILSLCPECTRIPTSSGWLPLHVAVAHQVSTRRLQKLLEVYPESIHALTRQGESVWSLAQKAPLDATSLELLRQSATSVASIRYVMGSDGCRTHKSVVGSCRGEPPFHTDVASAEEHRGDEGSGGEEVIE